MASTYIYKSEDYYRRFIKSIKAKQTRDGYDGKLRAFMTFLKIPEGQYSQLIDRKPEGQYSQLIDRKPVEEIYDDISRYISSLQERHCKRNTQKGHLSAIVHFYDMNYVTLSRKILSGYLSNDDINPAVYDGDLEDDRPYTREEIAKLLYHADIRTKVAILHMCSSGTRLGSLELLKIRDLTPVDKHALYQIKVYGNSKSSTRFTFCTPECRKAIDSYLDYRRKNGERVEPKSPLLRRDFNSDNWIRAANNTDKISREAVKRDILKFLYKSGLRSPEAIDTNIKLNNRRPVAMTHGFRKFFDTTCTKVGMNPIYIEWCMGHSLPGVKDSYFKPQPDTDGVYMDILEGNDKSLGYIAAIDKLTINEENRLKRQVEELTIRKDKLDMLAAQVERLSKTMGCMPVKQNETDNDKLDNITRQLSFNIDVADEHIEEGHAMLRQCSSCGIRYIDDYDHNYEENQYATWYVVSNDKHTGRKFQCARCHAAINPNPSGESLWRFEP